MRAPVTHESTAISRGSQALPEQENALIRHFLPVVGGILIAAIIYMIFPDTISDQLRETFAAKDMTVTRHQIAITAAIAVLMGVWWMTEAIPLPATALVPLIALPHSASSPLKKPQPPTHPTQSSSSWADSSSRSQCNAGTSNGESPLSPYLS